MAEAREDLLLEVLKSLQAGQNRIEVKLTECITRLGSLEFQAAGMHVDLAGINQRLDNFNARIERIEDRLGLIDA